MKSCSNCDNPRRKSGNYCLSCHAGKQREFRQHHSLTESQRMKMNARSYLHVYVKRGKIIKAPCAKCNNIKSEAHYPDYSKPLEVIWLCRECHLKLHYQNN